MGISKSSGASGSMVCHFWQSRKARLRNMARHKSQASSGNTDFNVMKLRESVEYFRDKFQCVGIGTVSCKNDFERWYFPLVREQNTYRYLPEEWIREKCSSLLSAVLPSVYLHRVKMQ